MFGSVPTPRHQGLYASILGEGPPHLDSMTQLISIVAIELRKARLIYNFRRSVALPRS
jgi:hypothetical protein